MNAKNLLTTIAGLALATGSAHAASIQVDVGDDVGSYSGTEAPAHSVGDLGVGDTFWNTLNGDANSGLFYSDGSAATGITIDFGRGQNPSAINWATALSGVTGSGGGTPPAFYATDLLHDWGFADGRSGPDTVGVRVQGLAPGEYMVYSINKEHSASTRTYDVGIGVDTDDTTAIGDLTISTIGGGLPAEWTAGTNYVSQSVTVNASTDWVVIMVDNTNSNFGQLNGFQIALVPEPSSLALLGLGGLLIARRRRG